MSNDKFYINKFGVKILQENSKAFIHYSEEIVSLEFFLIFLSFSTDKQEDIKNKKETLKILYENEDPRLLEFLESENSDIIFLSETYEKYIGQIAYTRITDNVLSYFKDILIEVIQSKPQILKSKESETLEYIFSFSNMEDLIVDISNKNIEKLFYGSINDIKKFFNDKLGIKLFKDNIVEKNFSQFVKQRNLIVHNRGIISKEFALEFSNESTTYTHGNTLTFTYENLSRINGAMTNLVVDLDLEICKKFKLKTYKA